MDPPRTHEDKDPVSFSRHTDEKIYREVEKIMKLVKDKLQDNRKLTVFLRCFGIRTNSSVNSFLNQRSLRNIYRSRGKIRDLQTDKRELVGVFGRTGAGKSSLINAVIEEEKLLPSGSITACTSVMVKVETDVLNIEYEADIEFITAQEWKDEVWSMLRIYKENPEEFEDQLDIDIDRLSAVCEDEWKHKSADELMTNEYFKEIPEFLLNRKKTLISNSRRDLSDKLKKYTKGDKEVGVKRLYWPLVKCVTIRLPENPHLQHVTLVDLPGTGDRNKSRDQMWKEIIGKCSVVWIVANINRAAAERETWEMLEDACSLMGNGGKCQKIHFICTKSDVIGDSDDLSAEKVRDLILQRNAHAKNVVKKEFQKLPNTQKHFSADCFEVLTVSSKEFIREKWLSREETQITRLQEILKDLNDNHSETLNYVSGAHGILSLIQGARCSAATYETNDVYKKLERNVKRELHKIEKLMEEACKAFEKCLKKAVEESGSSCEKDLQKLLNPQDGRAFYRRLKSAVENGGIHKSEDKEEINLNVTITSHLTDSINEQFRKTFPNEIKCGAFNGGISNFSLDIERLIKKHKDVELQLLFLQTEEANTKSKLNKFVQRFKKKIYNSLVETIGGYMDECYKKAATITGDGALYFMGEMILQHVMASKDTMFEQAKEKMMIRMRGLKAEVLETLSKNLQESMEVSLKADGNSLPVTLL